MLLIDEEIGEYKVNRKEYKFGEHAVSHCVVPSQQWCTCGKWQDREFPCIDGIAYLRNCENETLEGILMKHVSPLYNCRSLYHLYKKNIRPVIISTLSSDKTTLGPKKRKKKLSGSSKSQKNPFSV